MAEEETKHCSNCKRDIPAKNFIMHQSHCSRNISLCKHCGETVPHRQMEQHFEEVHAKVNCECGEKVEKQNLEDHKKDECNLRMKMCKFCEMDMAVKDLFSHEDFCGSRTEPCPICSRYICIKDREIHENSACSLPEQAPPVSTTHNKLHDNQAFLLGYQADGRFGAPQHFDSGFNITENFGMFDSRTVSPPVYVPRNTDERKHGKNKSRVQNLLGEKSKPDNRKGHRSQNRLSNPSEMDFLTRHLAQDLSKERDVRGAAVFESDIDTMLKEAYTIPDPPVAAARYLDVHDSAEQDDGTKLPCEFCGKPVPAQDLILHQSGCQFDQRPRESRQSRDRLISRGPPPLRIPSPPPSVSFEPDRFADEEVAMLPCEFCNVLLPADSIAFHQPTCDKNRTTTPLPSEHNNHPLDPSNIMMANSRPKLVTKKNPLYDSVATRSRSNHLPYQQDASLLPSPVSKYSSSNFSSMSGSHITHAYGNSTRKAHEMKQSSSQSSMQAQGRFQPFLDDDDDINSEIPSFNDDVDTFTNSEAFPSPVHKKTSNYDFSSSRNTSHGNKDLYKSFGSQDGRQDQIYQPKNRSTVPANRTAAPANRVRAPANRSGGAGIRNGASVNIYGSNRNEIPANYSGKELKVEKKPSRTRKISSEPYSPSEKTENHADQVRRFTEKAQRQKTVNYTANGTKPQKDGDVHPVRHRSHDQHARNARTSHHVSSRSVTLDTNEEPLSVNGRRQTSNKTHSRVKKPPHPDHY
ncbi:uncharacterized protein [Antedon mediterranea]|uniref:uncharacterized protein n=1 Tax=Antedon mediterranea TaxID=105859 RepID=UPI003AF8BA2E